MLETAISYILIIGVLASLFLEAIGMWIFYYSHSHMNISQKKEMFIHGQNFFSFLHDLVRGYHTEKEGLLLMIFGIAVLILTPYVRVVLSVLYFLWKRDIKYAFITAFVFIVLTISLYLH